MKGFLLHLPRKVLVAVAGVGMLCMIAIVACSVLGGIQSVSTNQTTVRIPAVMYHHILETPRLLGDYVISPQQFECDLQHLQAQGYTPVLPHELTAWVKGEGTLPDKPILITFDDGHKSTYIYALPLLVKYGMKAVLSPLTMESERFSKNKEENVQYAYISWEELKRLQDSGLFEIGNHTYNMHTQEHPRKGILRQKGESVQKYQHTLRKDLSTAQDLLRTALGEAPTTFAYPFGFVEPAADTVLDEMGFTVTLGAQQKVSCLVQGDLQTLKCIGRFNRPYSTTTETFFAKMLL